MKVLFARVPFLKAPCSSSLHSTALHKGFWQVIFWGPEPGSRARNTKGRGKGCYYVLRSWLLLKASAESCQALLSRLGGMPQSCVSTKKYEAFISGVWPSVNQDGPTRADSPELQLARCWSVPMGRPCWSPGVLADRKLRLWGRWYSFACTNSGKWQSDL